MSDGSHEKSSSSGATKVAKHAARASAKNPEKLTRKEFESALQHKPSKDEEQKIHEQLQKVQ